MMCLPSSTSTPPSVLTRPSAHHYAQESCGDFVAELCDYDQNRGCHHIFGELDVTMPEPQKKVHDGMYKVKVTDADESWNSGCSGAFSLRSAEDTPEHGDPDGAYIDVVSPMEADGAVAGEEYTVEVSQMRGARGWRRSYNSKRIR